MFSKSGKLLVLVTANPFAFFAISANIFGSGFPAKFVDSFSWGGADGIQTFKFEKAIEYSNNMMQRRDLQLTEDEIQILKKIAKF